MYIVHMYLMLRFIFRFWKKKFYTLKGLWKYSYFWKGKKSKQNFFILPRNCIFPPVFSSLSTFNIGVPGSDGCKRAKMTTKLLDSKILLEKFRVANLLCIQHIKGSNHLLHFYVDLHQDKNGNILEVFHL